METTIKLSKATADELARLKIHPRQSYEEIIKQILSKTKVELNEGTDKPSDAHNPQQWSQYCQY